MIATPDLNIRQPERGLTEKLAMPADPCAAGEIIASATRPAPELLGGVGCHGGNTGSLAVEENKAAERR